MKATNTFLFCSIVAGFLSLAALSGCEAGPTKFEVQYQDRLNRLKRPIPKEDSFDVVTKEGEKFIARSGSIATPRMTAVLSSTSAITDLVLADNTTGNVFPGALLWSKDLAEGAMVPVTTVRDRPPLKVVLADLTTIDSPLGDGDSRTSFNYDGTFGGFRDRLDAFLPRIKSQSPRLEFSVTTGRSSVSTLKKMGLSAGGWGAKLGWDQSRQGSARESFALVSLSEIYYTAVVDSPRHDQLLPMAAIDRDPGASREILRQLSRRGEPVYVRSVR